MKSYEQKIWLRAVQDAESDVMRNSPGLIGGRKERESVEDYVRRGRKFQDEALAQLAFARKKLNEAFK